MRFAVGLVLVAGCDQAFGLTIATDAPPGLDDARRVDARSVDAAVIPGVVAHYSMDAVGVGGCMIDDSGHGHDGDCSGTQIVVVGGQIGHAFAFGGGARIEVATTGSLVGPGAFRFAGWINYTGSLMAGMCPFNRLFGGAGADSWQVCMNENAVNFYFDPGTVVSTQLISSHVWHHLAIVSTGASVTTYIDGMSNGTQTLQLMFDGGPLEIGSDVDPDPAGDGPVVGAIDDIWIFDRALIPAEIVALELP